MTSTMRRESARWVEPVGRIGLATQGVLYAVVALLALQVASGRVNDRADQRGAIEAVANQSFGRLLLFVLTIGLAFHCAWRLLLAYRGDPGEDDAKEWMKRAGHFGRALIYGGFTLTAAKVLLDADTGSGNERQKAASKALDFPGGGLLLIVVGIAVIGTGLWHASKLFTQSFTDDLGLDRCSDGLRKIVTVLGSIGYAARGIVFVLVGWFLVQAGIDQDPNESAGLDFALKRLANSEHGPGTLRLLAMGLLVFGVYRVVDACVRKREEVANA
ncbi:MAG: hypothetical protein QOH79_2266 [Acidimicrobiaceae bacterium]|jgi:hypothetical protein